MYLLFRKSLNPFFNSEGEGGGSESSPVVTPSTPSPPEPTTPAPETNSTPTHNPLRTGNLEAPVVPAPTVPVVEEIDFGGRKVKVIDPVIHDLAKDYRELTGTLTKESQRVREMEAEILRLKTLPTPAPAAPEVVQPVAPSPEKMKELNDKYLEMQYEDPVGAQFWLQQQPEYQQMLKPLQQQQVETALTENQKAEKARQDDFQAMRVSMEGKYADFKDMVPHMMEAVKQFPSLAEKMINSPSVDVLEEAYNIAKLLGGQTASTPVTPVVPQAVPTTPESAQTLNLADPEVMKLIMANPQITNQIITSYINGVNNNQQQIPVVLGNQPGGSSPAMPPQLPSSIKEAGKMFKASMQRNPQL